MTTLSMAEILNTAARTKKKEDKIAILRQNNSKELRNVLLLMYDKSFQLDLPDSAPPYTPSEIPESHGLLYREARKLAYFVKGRSEGAGINRIRKETIFIQMLEAVDKEDAKLLIQMIERKPIKGLSSDLLIEAYGFTIKEPVDKKRTKSK